MSQKRSSVYQEKINRGDAAELATKKGRQVFQEKIEGVTPSVAAPGVANPSDATGPSSICALVGWKMDNVERCPSPFLILGDATVVDCCSLRPCRDRV